MRLDRLDPLCMPFTIPEGGRSIAAGRAEEEEVVAVTSGGTEKFSKKRENIEMAINIYLLLSGGTSKVLVTCYQQS